MPRDNFSRKTIKNLAESVGFQCVRPGCAQLTHYFDKNTGVMRSLGQASHDSAASEGGPRYDITLTPEQRKSYENGANLCARCAVVVDVDEDRFPVGTLSTWQITAVEIRNHLGMSSAPLQGIQMREAFSATELFIKECDSFIIDYYEYSLRNKDLDIIYKLLSDCYGFRPSNPYYGQYPHIVNKQIQIINTLTSIKGLFSQRDYRLVYSDTDFNRKYLCRPPRYQSMNDDISLNNLLRKNIELFQSRCDDYYHLSKELKDIVYNITSYPINLMQW